MRDRFNRAMAATIHAGAGVAVSVSGQRELALPTYDRPPPGRPTLTLADMAARAGLPIDVVTRRWRAAGFPDPGPDTPVVSEAESEVFAMLEGAERLFGREAVLQLTRVIGSATARIADAAVSTFLVNAELPRLGTAQAELAVARANAEAATLLPLLFRAIEVILRRHLLAARRSLLSVDRQAGIASGAVMLRDGDCFGAVVNLAARAVKLARPGHIVVSGHVRAAVEGAFVCVPLPPARIKGFEGDIQLFELGG